MSLICFKLTISSWILKSNLCLDGFAEKPPGKGTVLQPPLYLSLILSQKFTFVTPHFGGKNGGYPQEKILWASTGGERRFIAAYIFLNLAAG